MLEWDVQKTHKFTYLNYNKTQSFTLGQTGWRPAMHWLSVDDSENDNDDNNVDVNDDDNVDNNADDNEDDVVAWPEGGGGKDQPR